MRFFVKGNTGHISIDPEKTFCGRSHSIENNMVPLETPIAIVRCPRWCKTCLKLASSKFTGLFVRLDKLGEKLDEERIARFEAFKFLDEATANRLDKLEKFNKKDFKDHQSIANQAYANVQEVSERIDKLEKEIEYSKKWNCPRCGNRMMPSHDKVTIFCHLCNFRRAKPKEGGV